MSVASEPASNKIFWLGLCLFLAAKAFWVIVPALSMGIPRLGDDSLVYLWNGASAVLSPKAAEPAIESIAAFRALDDSPGPSLEWARARVTMRTTGITDSPFAIATGSLLNLGLSHKVAFAATECLTALVLAIATGFFCGKFFGSAAAGATLAVMTFSILPNQGLHYLVPGVLVLALSFVLWVIMLKRSVHWAWTVPVATLMLLVHPIGQVYVLVALALVAAQGVLQGRLDRRALPFAAGLAIAVCCWQLIHAISGARAPLTAGLGGLSLSQAGVNAFGLLKHLKALAVSTPVIAVMLVAGLVRGYWLRRSNPDAFVLAGTLLLTVTSTVVVDLPGYPGELPSRILIALIIVTVAICCEWLLSFVMTTQRAPVLRYWFAGAGLALMMLSQVPLYMRYFYGNLNSRHQIYDQALLRKELARLQPQSVLLWVDTDLAMMASLLEGGDRFRTVPYPMLGNGRAIAANIGDPAHVVIGTSAPERLSGASTIQSRSLQARYYGYGFDLFRRLSLTAGPGQLLPRYVRLAHDYSGLLITTELGRSCLGEPLSGELEGWIRIVGCDDARELHFEDPLKLTQVRGLSVSRPQNGKNWPWGATALQLRAEPRKTGEPFQMTFGMDYLLGSEVSSELQSSLGQLSLLSDASGIVFLQAGSPQVFEK